MKQTISTAESDCPAAESMLYRHEEYTKPQLVKQPCAHERLRRVALQLFVEQGFQSVSLRQLANALGMQAGSLYNHMDSKQALLFELIEEHESDLLDTLRAEDPSNASGLQRLRQYIHSHVHFSLANHGRQVLSRLELRQLTNEQKNAIMVIRLAQIEHMRGIIKQISSKYVRDEGKLTLVVRSVMTILDDYPEWRLPSRRLDALVEFLTQLAVVGITYQKFQK
ncbi:TetR/AcrR family transcriptional regulator [Pseudomonas sp. R3.Fl]|uniref:TetR/AcrR family transcriptional regulator n=1 Tax=Pseudomonas TaxID=286 RepID=UPI0009ED54AA|nr:MULTISPECIES: TetR/AcrR family transcriptional regulator [Pseudomonas]MCL6692118.1 TetR/AcrR family transcriptional regulator [Pseudomonas sp. R3.Fl]MDN6875735.1 TetR/AcrR family transcriptional regulator [Pseudomonas citronellolis]WRT80741.1 TetR/AcrR family transcriptional regulator [Pseudomonas citronellolis]